MMQGSKAYQAFCKECGGTYLGVPSSKPIALRESKAHKATTAHPISLAYVFGKASPSVGVK